MSSVLLQMSNLKLGAKFKSNNVDIDVNTGEILDFVWTLN